MDITTVLLIWTAGLLITGSYTDFRWREVPDWLNFAALAAALGTRLIFSLATGNWSYIWIGLAGLGITLAIAYGMFYLGQWGGGDSKMLLALGALLGFQLALDSYGVAFFINLLLCGAAYGLVWSAMLAITHWVKFSKELHAMWQEANIRWSVRGSFIACALILVVSLFLPFELRLSFAIFAICIPVVMGLGILIKAIEVGCMIRRVPPTVLTEGDWLVRDVVVGGKRIAGPKDLGVSIPQIRKMVALMHKGKLRSVLLKEGIPFVPSFLLAFIVTIAFGNLVLLIVP